MDGRVMTLLEQWLPLLGYCSGAVVPVRQVTRGSASSAADPVPRLDQQLKEILDFVALREQMWSTERLV
jgi:hypothetical protein